MKELLDYETAFNEINDWAKGCGFRPKKINDLVAERELLIEALQYGMIEIIDGKIHQKLSFTTLEEKGKGVEKLVWRQRWTAGEKVEATKGISQNDGENRLIAYIATLTDMPKGVIKKIDGGFDFDIAGAIAVYFL